MTGIITAASILFTFAAVFMFGFAHGATTNLARLPGLLSHRAFWWGIANPLGPPRPWWTTQRREQWYAHNGLPWGLQCHCGRAIAEKR